MDTIDGKSIHHRGFSYVHGARLQFFEMPLCRGGLKTCHLAWRAGPNDRLIVSLLRKSGNPQDWEVPVMGFG